MPFDGQCNISFCRNVAIGTIHISNQSGLPIRLLVYKRQFYVLVVAISFIPPIASLSTMCTARGAVRKTEEMLWKSGLLFLGPPRGIIAVRHQEQCKWVTWFSLREKHNENISSAKSSKHELSLSCVSLPRTFTSFYFCQFSLSSYLVTSSLDSFFTLMCVS